MAESDHPNKLGEKNGDGGGEKGVGLDIKWGREGFGSGKNGYEERGESDSDRNHCQQKVGSESKDSGTWQEYIRIIGGGGGNSKIG